MGSLDFLYTSRACSAVLSSVHVMSALNNDGGVHVRRPFLGLQPSNILMYWALSCGVSTGSSIVGGADVVGDHIPVFWCEKDT